MISGKTKIYGIFGHPVQHTFSPRMHNAAFNHIVIDACYVPFLVHPDRLGDAVKAMRALNICGLNVTVPHKEKVLAYLDELSEEARLIGAVNTIEARDGMLIGHNTDGRGFIRSLKTDAGFRPRGKRFLIIGSGGAARAVGFSLAISGAKKVSFRDIEAGKAERLAGNIRDKTGVEAQSVDESALMEFAEEADCLINATPLGLRKSDPLPILPEHIRRNVLVCDLVYNPPDTKLLKIAGKAGAKGLGGLGMLLYQGVIAFEIWTGRKAPVQVMKKALISQMRGRKT